MVLTVINPADETAAHTISLPETPAPACPVNSKPTRSPCLIKNLLRVIGLRLGSPGVYSFNLNLCKGLTVSQLALAALLGTVGENRELLSFTVFQNPPQRWHL